MISSCTIDEKDIIERNMVENNPDQIINGLYQDPYSIDIMNQAYLQLKNENKIQNTLNIRGTHYYVKFLPKNWNEYDSLILNDRDLKLYNFPLNSEIQIENNTLQEESITPFYTCVDINYAFRNDVEYEILGLRYFPDLDVEFPDVVNKEDLILLLEERAEYIANPSLIITENNSNLSRYNPSGKVMINDDEVYLIEQSKIPLRGVQVRVRRWSKIRYTTTDELGLFNFKAKYIRPVNYAIFYQRNDFDIRSGRFGQAWINGPKLSGAWELNIEDNLNKYYGHIFQAANDYWYSYRANFQIGSPPQNGFFRPAFKIAAINSTNNTINGQTHPFTRLLGILTQIEIYNPDRTSSETYSTTIHEIGHAAHWWLDRSSYNQCDDKISESWCRGVQYYITNFRYAKIGEYYNTTFNYNFSSGWQTYNKGVQWQFDLMQDGYTPIVIDLIDNFNQRFVYSNNLNYAPDNVSNFTLSEVWNTLKGSISMYDWKQKLKSLNKTNSTDLDSLFDFYINI